MVATVATVGTFNVLIVRRLLEERIDAASKTVKGNMFDSGVHDIHQQSACAVYVTPDSTATGLPEIFFDVASQ